MANIEMVIDSVRAALTTNMKTVMLKEKERDRYLPIWVGSSDAESITVKLQDLSILRPQTHDFICAIISRLGCTIREAVISKLENDTFFAELIIMTDYKKVKRIDCRPSDVLAVSIRSGISIYAEEKVLAKAGITLDEKESLDNVDVLETQVIKYDIFAKSAHDIINESEEQAKRLNHTYINTGHILLALTKIVTPANEVLSNLGIYIPTFVKTIEESIAKQPDIESAKPGLTPIAKKAIERSIDECKRLGSNRVQPEHILLGLVRQEEGIATSLLKKGEINVEKIYIELIRLYNRQQPPASNNLPINP